MKPRTTTKMPKKPTSWVTAAARLFAIGVATATALSAHAEDLRDASTVTIMSYNIYRGGTMRKQPLSQTAKVIQDAKADIVGLQEMRSPKGDNTDKLAALLGWNHHASIFTPYEIVKEKKNGIKVRLPSGQQAYVFNLHLPSNPYQPYQLLEIRPKWHKHWDTPFIKTEAEAIESANQARGREITSLLKEVQALPDSDTPVFVVGDFNEPSHLDWTEATAKAGRHPIKVAFPTSLAMKEAGFRDAWRVVFPNEMQKPGFTWSPLTTPDDPKDHHDRIDFVYFRGTAIHVTEAKVVGESQENADVVISPYPSDHRAIVATFMLPNKALSNP